MHYFMIDYCLLLLISDPFHIQEDHPLRTLDISYCDIGPIGGEHIAKGIQVLYCNDKPSFWVYSIITSTYNDLR